ncbi:eco57I restriction-modification methylase family protein, partial [Candidatus Magnetomorum sp. HK-1]
MNTSKIKAYAPQARNDFIQAVTERANLYGIFDDQKIEPFEAKGDVALIGDRPFSKKEGVLRERLASRVKREGFQQVVEAYAYTWFNRFVALRYMELHDYLDHGFRVLSNQSGSDVPEILENAAEVEFEGLKKDKVIELRLAGNKDNELYRLLIVAQCNALHKAMPFLFDRIDNETELLLPDNLLHSNSPIRKLVNDIDEDSWQDVEIIGWIYQFYISEKKDQVIGKVVKSEDIPAATQLFTPNWIVKYMVQNTLGRMWLATYPDSGLRDKMEYYIEPAEQEQEVQAELDRITPGELNPEEITFLDPACGSGHILIEAYGIFKEIYLERGYRTRDIPRLILEKNIFGLDICDRAAQLACFAVLMKAREDDRRILGRDDLKLNVMDIQESDESDVKNIEIFFKDDEDVKEGLKEVIKLYEDAKTFGSLITVPENLVGKRKQFETAIQKNIEGLFRIGNVERLEDLFKQTEILKNKFDCVVTNPPYIGGRGMNPKLKDFAKDQFPDSKLDLFAMFIECVLELSAENKFVGIITMQSWMFLTSFGNLRESILNHRTVLSMAHLGARAFDSIGGEVVSTTSFTLLHSHYPEYKGSYIRLVDGNSEAEKKNELIQCISQSKTINQKSNLHLISAEDFKKIPGNPIAYWLGSAFRDTFKNSAALGSISTSAVGQNTGDNDRFLRHWFEVEFNCIFFNCSNRDVCIASGMKWFPYNKGGSYRKWYGNFIYVIYWKDDAKDIKDYAVVRNKGKHWSRYIQNLEWIFKEGLTWSDVTSGKLSCRYLPKGYISDVSGHSAFFNNVDHRVGLSIVNSRFSCEMSRVLNPTMHFQAGNYRNLPYSEKMNTENVIKKVNQMIDISKRDWDSFETSWNFNVLHFLQSNYHNPIIRKNYITLRTHWQKITSEMQRLEEENNRVFVESYGLQQELAPDVSLSEITLTCNPHYRYGGNKSKEELEGILQTDTIKELISYSIGCMMGRYSLDHPGLIYAHS